MKTHLIRTNVRDLALDALMADFVAERLMDNSKTAIAFCEAGQAWVKTNADTEALADAKLEASIRFEAFLRVHQPSLDLPKLSRAA